MGKASNRKKAARLFREEQGMTKLEWKKLLVEDKKNKYYGNSPVVRREHKVNSKYPKQTQ